MPLWEPITMVFGDGKEINEQLILDGPGGEFRVVVGEPNRQSGSWKIWSPPRKSDVYVAVRAIGGYQKWSLHESGDWRFQWVNDERAKQFGKATRIIEQWQQPGEVGDTGWTKGFSILVRQKDLVHVADPERVPNSAIRIPEPPEGHVSGIHVAMARPNMGYVPTPGQLPLGGITLADGRALLLLVTVQPVIEEQDQSVDAAIRATVEASAKAGLDLAKTSAPRMALFGHSEDGHRSVWDVAIPIHEANEDGG